MPERYQREIEDILQQAGDLGSGNGKGGPSRSFPRLVWLQLVRSLSGKPWSISPGRVMLTAVVLLLSALLMGALVPGLASPVAWAGLVLFIVGYAMFFIRPARGGLEKRWRGQPMDYDRDTWWNRLRRRIR